LQYWHTAVFPHQRPAMKKTSQDLVARYRARKAPVTPPPCRPGTALKALLSWFRIDVGKGCACKNRAAQMDRWGCDESERRIEQIVGWLREEAGKRRLPFANVIGRMLVRLAIRNARKAARN
jgi:hypothetical protein